MMRTGLGFSRAFFSCFVVFVGIGFLFFNCRKSVQTKATAESSLTVTNQVSTVKPVVIKSFPHDSLAFTQGLLYEGGNLYESTGLVGRSSLRLLTTVSDTPKTILSIPSVFAEGLALMGSKLYVLTWKNRVALVYDRASFKYEGSFSYDGEGWGLTSNGNEFIMSNGSDTLFVRNKNFGGIKKILVTYKGLLLVNINELEYARGYIYANVWYSDLIFKIDPSSGAVVSVIDCSTLSVLSGTTNADAVLNGIAFNEEANTFFVTGKLWHRIFEVTMP